VRVLVIDDDPNVREALGELLRCEGYEPRLAIHGRDALEQLASGPHPDVIVTDLMMPVLDGWRLIRELHDHPAWRSIPVVVLSASENLKALENGTVAVLGKPADVGRLLDTVAYAARRAVPA
jgi:CheY-like chemotaxis protein